MSATTRVYVCTTCRAEGDASQPPEARAGARLLAGLRAALGQAPGVELVPVECLSVCRRPVTVAFAATGKWTYVYGDLSPELSPPVLIEALGHYVEAPDGLIPWKKRSDPIKKGVVARLPPFPAAAKDD